MTGVPNEVKFGHTHKREDTIDMVSRYGSRNRIRNS